MTAGTIPLGERGSRFRYMTNPWFKGLPAQVLNDPCVVGTGNFVYWEVICSERKRQAL